MPESPFADLFGKLPDPRSRDVKASGARGTADEEPGTTPAGGATPASDGPSAPPAPPAAEADAPLSRRAAREAAARQPSETDAAPAASPAPTAPFAPAAPTAQPSAPPVPAAAAQADMSPASPSVGGDVRAPAGAPATDARPRRASGDPGLDDLFAKAATTDELEQERMRKKRRRRRRSGWIALGIVVVLLGGVTAGGLYVWNTYERQIRQVMGWQEPAEWEAGLATGEALVTITEGELPPDISRALFDAEVTRTADAFYDMLIKTGQNPTFFPGVYRLQQKMTSEAALAALQDPANKLENTAQLPEGLTVEQSLPLLADGTGIPLADFQAAAADPSVYGIAADPAIVAAGGNPLEGWLFPATYTFDPGSSATDVIQRLVNETLSRLDAAGVAVEDRERILTIASIIQREARYEVDMQKVSRVILNRLDASNQETSGLLQMDSTAQYGFGEQDAGSASTSEEAQYNDNPWNTYVRAGLPVGPIANPGDAAISAALNPADGDWLYFVTVNLDTGETVFTSNLADHNRAVAQWQAWCTENPDSGC